MLDGFNFILHLDALRCWDTTPKTEHQKQIVWYTVWYTVNMFSQEIHYESRQAW